MRVLTVNVGSSSVKLRVIDEHDGVAWSRDLESWDPKHGTARLNACLEEIDQVDAIGHRIVHGGTDRGTAAVVDHALLDALEQLTPLAPVHQPRALAAMREVAHRWPDLTTVACFDTGFHATIPEAAATYALPEEWRRRWPLRRFGFHGLSHAWASAAAAEALGRELDPDLRVITCHLGAGSSLCAVKGGRSVDTTMGFSPLEGLVMATRSGSVDPGLVLWLVREAGLTPDDVHDALEHRSGLVGLAPTVAADGDIRDVLVASERDDGAALAIAVWVHRLRREIGAMAASLGGVDALAFTGGIGEHQPVLRAAAVEGVSFLGAALDESLNATTYGVDADVSAMNANCRTLVVVAREDLEIARQVRNVVHPHE